MECEPEEADTFFINRVYADTPLARPLWNKACAPPDTFTADLSPLIYDNCIAVFSGWRPDGGTARGDTLEFRTYLCGDANDDNIVNILDVIVLIDYKFKAGPPPANMIGSNIDCDDNVTVLDILDLIDYVNISGEPPCCGMCCDLN